MQIQIPVPRPVHRTDDQLRVEEAQYGLFIDALWAKVKTIKDDRKFAEALLELEASHPRILDRQAYNKQREFIERIFMKQAFHGQGTS